MKLIDKDKVVDEIERIAKCEETWMDKQGYTEYHQGLRDAYKRILSSLDTLEVKEVDLKKEIQDKIWNHFYDLEGIAIAGTSIYATVDDMVYIAKHFFELGLKAQKGE